MLSFGVILLALTMVGFLTYDSHLTTQNKRIALEMKRLEVLGELQSPKNHRPEMIPGREEDHETECPVCYKLPPRALPPAPPEDAQKPEGWGTYD